MSLNRKLFKKVAAAADTFTPSEHFNTVLYTGNGGTQKIGGYINRGAVFNGSSSYIDLGNNSSNNGSLISVSCWFKTISTASEGMVWNNGANDSQSTGLALSVKSPGVLFFQANTLTTFVNDTGTTTVNDGDWHHVVVNYDNGDFNVYLDGNSTPELSGTSSAFTTTANRNFLIGRLSRVATAYFDGVIDQFRIFNRELTTSEVTTLYGETHSSTTISTTDIFSDDSGVALYQFDGNANDTGGASGKFGAAGIFNGSSSYISTPNPLGTGNVAYSISAWINLNSSSHTGGIYTIWDSGTTAGTYLFFKVESGSISIGNYGSTVTSSNTLSTNQWVHVVVTRDTSNNVVLYVNGASDTTGTLSLNLGNHSAKIGALASSTQNFNGRIDDVRIYSDVLTSTEVGYIYNNTTASIPTDNLEAYYKLNGDARDETVPSYDGAASNVTYAYDGTATNITYQEATKFSPDLVWIKRRNSTGNPEIYDSVRGEHKVLQTDGTTTEYNYSTTGVTDFDSNGFSVAGSAGNHNVSGGTFAAWCWNAGSGSSASNTDGSETTTVSANQDAGFSIVKLNKTDTNLRTYGHGLSSVVEMIILKRTASSDDWYVYHKDLGNTSRISLNSTASVVTGTGVWGSTTPTDEVFTLENQLGGDHIAYCFHSVDGYQKIGSYDGTGAAGNMVETGFEPAFLLIKQTNTSGSNWNIIDNKRDTENPRDVVLWADTSDTESTASQSGVYDVNFLSNGFSLENTYQPFNASGGTYIYLAIAADPDTTTPTVENSFDVVTFEGTGAAQDLEFDMKPDLIWFKDRDGVENHQLYDTIRGVGNAIYSNLTTAQTNQSQGVTAFNDDGVSIGTETGINRSGNSFVAWGWEAGDHDDNLPQINENGSISSVTSVNDAAGFSIVKWEGTDANATVGHGLSAAPELIFFKATGATNNWGAYAEPIGATKFLVPNLSNAAATSSTPFNDTAPTSTVISLGSSGSFNRSGGMIAYCWYSVSGHSKIGSYTGNDTSQTIDVGFQPRFVMIKNTSSASTNWVIFDSLRDNGDEWLYPNASDGTYDDSNTYTSFASNGFSVNTNAIYVNANNDTYIYMAFK